jgi:hypothetical protein
MYYFSVYRAYVIEIGKVIIAEAAGLCIIFTMYPVPQHL